MQIDRGADRRLSPDDNLIYIPRIVLETRGSELRSVYVSSCSVKIQYLEGRVWRRSRMLRARLLRRRRTTGHWVLGLRTCFISKSLGRNGRMDVPVVSPDNSCCLSTVNGIR